MADLETDKDSDMPLIRIQTNTLIPNASVFSEALTNVASEWLGKSRRYIMVQLFPEIQMTMAGLTDPCAFVQFSSISLSRNQIKTVSSELTKMLSRELSIKGDRIYIEFNNVIAENWSWDGATFG